MDLSFVEDGSGKSSLDDLEELEEVSLFSIDVISEEGVGGNDPFPLSSQYSSTSGNSDKTFKTKSKLGLFLPDKI